MMGPSTLNIKVSLLSHGLMNHFDDVTVPSNSTFGDLKSTISQKTGVNPETHKLFFRGKEIEDDVHLQTAGIKDNSKVLLKEDITSQQKVIPEEVKETSVISKGDAAVAEVRADVDKLSEQVSALKAVVDSGTQVDVKDIIYVTEMLMRQLLKLDGIDAEGEGKMQRKLEVRRVQGFVDIMDDLKSRNSNPFIMVNNPVSVTTQWETFEPTPLPSSIPTPSFGPPPSTPVPMSSSTPIGAPSPIASPVPSSPPTTPPPSMPAPMRSPTPSGPQSSISTPVPSSAPSPLTSSVPSPVPSSAPSPVPSSASSPLPSSTKVTEDWEQFD